MNSQEEEWSIISSSSDLDDDQSTQSSVHSSTINVQDNMVLASVDIDNDNSLATLKLPKFAESNLTTKSPEPIVKELDTPENQKSKISDVILYYEDLNLQIKASSNNFWAAAKSRLSDQEPPDNVKDSRVLTCRLRRIHNAYILDVLDANSEYLIHYLVAVGIAVISAFGTYYLFHQSFQAAPPVAATPYDDMKSQIWSAWNYLVFQPEDPEPWFNQLWPWKRHVRVSRLHQYTKLAAVQIHVVSKSFGEKLSEIQWSQISNGILERSNEVSRRAVESLGSFPSDQIRERGLALWQQFKNDNYAIASHLTHSLKVLKSSVDSLAIHIYRLGNALVHHIDAFIAERTLRLTT